MIDPWIALGTNMALLGAFGALLTYARRDVYTRLVDYVAAAFIMAIVGGCAAMLAWGLTRGWTG